MDKPLLERLGIRYLRTLSGPASAAIDGRLTSRERRLLADAFGACGRDFDQRSALRLRHAFVSGDEIPARVVQAIV